MTYSMPDRGELPVVVEGHCAPAIPRALKSSWCRPCPAVRCNGKLPTRAELLHLQSRHHCAIYRVAVYGNLPW